MREFAERFGDTERIDLETTFRCSKPIADVATQFVLENRAQIRKNVRSTRQLQGPCVHVGLPGAQGLSLLEEALGRIAAHAAGYEGNSSVLLLGRYRRMRPQNLAALARQHSRLRLDYMTVHGSKGLQADYAVVLGLCAGRHGFPTEIEDDPLLDLVLAAPEKHPNAEERRLFYVALTRARRHVFPGGRRPAVALRAGTGRGELRRRRLRAVAGEGPAMSEIRQGASGAPRERTQQGHLLRLLELALLRANTAAVPCLPQRIAGQGEGRVPLSQLRSADRGVSLLRWLAATPEGQARPLSRLLELACVQLHPGRCATPAETGEIR